MKQLCANAVEMQLDVTARGFKLKFFNGLADHLGQIFLLVDLREFIFRSRVGGGGGGGTKKKALKMTS